MTIAQPKPVGIAAPRNVALLLGMFVAILAGSVVAGWVLDIAMLRNALPFGLPMRANAAIGLTLCGLALTILSLPRLTAPGRVVATIVGAIVVLLGVLTISQDLAGWNLGIDQWLIRDTTGTARFTVPGRMSPPTSFSLTLVGIAMILASCSIRPQFRNPALAALGATVVVVGGIALTGHVSETMFEFRFLSYSRIASYAALGLMLLGCGVLALVRSEGGLKWSLDAGTTGGFLIGVLAMIMTAGISYQFTSRLQADAAVVSQTQKVIEEIHELTGIMGEFTISAGRYIITRDERTLAGREKTKAAIHDGIAELRQLLADSPNQFARLDEIERIHGRRIVMSEKIIADFRLRIRSGRLPIAGEASPLGVEYPQLGRDIERLLKEMEGVEIDLLDQQRAQSRATSRKTFLLLPLGVFVSLVMLSLGLFFLNESATVKAATDIRLAQKRERLNVLHAIDRAIITAETPSQIAEAALPRLRDLIGLPRVTVNMLDLEKGEAEWLVSVGRHRSHVGPGIRFSMELMGDLEGLKRGEMQVVDVGALSQRREAEALLASDVRWYRVVPMIVGDELIGALSFGGPSKEFPLDLLEITQEVAAQLAIAIAQSRLADRARIADAQYRLIFDTVPVGITMTDLKGRLLSVNAAWARMLGYESEREVLTAMNGQVRALYADPAAREEYLRILRRDGVVSSFETQFIRKDGSRVWISMSGRPVHDLAEADPRLVTMLDDITLRKEQEHRIARLSRVKDMQSSINSAVARIRERQALLDETCRVAVEQGGLRAAWVSWHDAEARKLRPISFAGHIEGLLEVLEMSTADTPETGVGLSLQVLRSGVSAATNDLRTAAGMTFRQEALDRGYQATMHLPLKIDGQTEGLLVLCASEAGFFDDEERPLLDELAADVSFALTALQKSERLDYLAYYDPLTGLPNRSLFHDRLSHSLHSRGDDARLIAVVLLDLARFRRVNETLGRQVGDELLREFGMRLQGANDTTARIGVDIYGMTLRGARNPAEVNRSLESIVSACFAEPFKAGAAELRVACRAGVAIYPADGTDADTLLRNAEAALRRSKAADDRVVFYEPEMNARVAEALAIENKLRRAIERREFVLHYQPKVALSNAQVVGVEALIRWQEPGKGLVPPGHFIPILEETGMIVEVGRWAVEQAFVDLRAWAARGIKVPRVAVNVSAIQLQRKDFVDQMVDEITRGGDTPEWLELEITESLVMRNVEDSIRKLSILRGMGVTVAIDDFGTGYSSLSYLGRLPVDTLKIDRSFVIGVASSGDSTTLVTTVIALAHGLKLKVVAEGVETAEQAQVLRLLRCDEAQGYFYSRPVPSGEIEKLLLAGGALPAA